MDWNAIAVLMLRFALTMAFNVVQLRIVASFNKENKSHLYSFVIISVVVFFLSHALSSFNMQLGMAIGLFAVFGIVRYRTEALDPQEMTYLFSAIGIALINALSGGVMGWIELVSINLIVLLFIFVLEKFYLPSDSHEEEDTKRQKISVLLPLEELKETNVTTRVEELAQTLGVQMVDYKVVKVDYTVGHVQVQLFYE